MNYERVDKEALYFSKEEIELLCSCVGKEVVAVHGHVLDTLNGKLIGALETLCLEFSDGVIITVSNEFADMPYLPGEGDDTSISTIVKSGMTKKRVNSSRLKVGRVRLV